MMTVVFVLQLYYQVLNFGMIVSSALMIWKGLMVVTGSESPIVVVLRCVVHFQAVECKRNNIYQCYRFLTFLSMLSFFKWYVHYALQYKRQIYDATFVEPNLFHYLSNWAPNSLIDRVLEDYLKVVGSWVLRSVTED